MLKVRLMGTKNDIAWFQKILQRHPKIEVMELSELYSNKQTEQRDAYIDGLAFGIRTISEAFLHENKNKIW